MTEIEAVVNVPLQLRKWFPGEKSILFEFEETLDHCTQQQSFSLFVGLLCNSKFISDSWMEMFPELLFFIYCRCFH